MKINGKFVDIVEAAKGNGNNARIYKKINKAKGKKGLSNHKNKMMR